MPSQSRNGWNLYNGEDFLTSVPSCRDAHSSWKSPHCICCIKTIFAFSNSTKDNSPFTRSETELQAFLTNLLTEATTCMALHKVPQRLAGRTAGFTVSEPTDTKGLSATSWLTEDRTEPLATSTDRMVLSQDELGTRDPSSKVLKTLAPQLPTLERQDQQGWALHNSGTIDWDQSDPGSLVLC